MQRTLSILMTAVFLFFCSFSRAEEAPIPATPSRWVTDTVGFLSPETQQSLDKHLEEYQKSSGMKVAVWIGKTAGDAALETWAQSSINAWKTRDKGFAEGIVLFLLTEDQAIDIEVAPGLQSRLSDEFIAQVIMEQMAPLLNKGEKNQALTQGIDAILTQLIKTKPQNPPKATPPSSEQTPRVASPTPTPSAENTQSGKPESTPETTSTIRTPSSWMLIMLGLIILLSIIVGVWAGSSQETK